MSLEIPGYQRLTSWYLWVPSRDREQGVPHTYFGIRATNLLLAKMLKPFYLGIKVKLGSSVCFRLVLWHMCWVGLLYSDPSFNL